MNSAAFSLVSYISLLCLLASFPPETSTCDTKWIRLVYMMSCGKKKRESVTVRNNETFHEDLPGDFEGALRYFRGREPFSSMLTNDAYLSKILEEDEKSFRLHHQVPKLFLGTDETVESTSSPTTKKSSILINKLLLKVKTGNNLGIQGFPEEWDIEEIFDEKINENHRREIDRLIEECCKVPPVITCNANTFLGACK